MTESIVFFLFLFFYLLPIICTAHLYEISNTVTKTFENLTWKQDMKKESLPVLLHAELKSKCSSLERREREALEPPWCLQQEQKMLEDGDLTRCSCSWAGRRHHSPDWQPVLWRDVSSASVTCDTLRESDSHIQPQKTQQNYMEGHFDFFFWFPNFHLNKMYYRSKYCRRGTVSDCKIQKTCSYISSFSWT